MPEGGDAHHLVADAADAAEEADRESHAPSRGANIRSWAIMVASIAALLTSVGAIFKPQDHSVTQQGYEEITKSLQAVTTQQQQTHDDLIALRTYVADRNGEVFALPSQAAGGGGAASSAPLILKPLIRPAPSASSIGPMPLIPASTQPPPELHPFIKGTPPPTFDKVLTASKMRSAS